ISPRTRKNALFAGPDRGGEHWAIIASLSPRYRRCPAIDRWRITSGRVAPPRSETGRLGGVVGGRCGPRLEHAEEREPGRRPGRLTSWCRSPAPAIAPRALP